MKFFAPNIGKPGRIARGVFGALLLIGGIFVLEKVNFWIGLAVMLSALFVLFEAMRGWCIVRACGIRTKM